MTDMSPIPELPLRQDLARSGFAFVTAPKMRAMFEAAGPLADWSAFAESWNHLAVDTYMADGGRYRKRRHAVYEAGPKGGIARAAHQPHFQGLDYNALNGGIERWFEPVAETIGAGASMTTILEFCHDLFGALAPVAKAWKVEVHQFRIEAKVGETGQPTPEGMHRDGVDYVLVLLVKRNNIASGTTTITDLNKTQLGSFTLTEPFDAALVDDARAFHGVTPVVPVDPKLPAYRDVLVVTFRQKPAEPGNVHIKPEGEPT
jgi:hypothetical protein